MAFFRTSILVAISAWSCAAASAECTRQEAIAAEEIASGLRSWAEVHSAFSRFRHCDDGAIGEGFSESVSILVAEHWGQLGTLLKLTAKSQSFRQFVLRHLDETLPADRWSVIEVNAKERCPSNARALCKSILSRSHELSANPAIEETLRDKAAQRPSP